GNLVRFAEGDGGSNRNPTIILPVSAAGTYYIKVSQANNTPTPTVGEYGLVVSGATGGLPAMAVSSTTPAAGALVQPPTSYTVVSNPGVSVPSVTAGDFTINGVAATDVTLVDAHTVTWTFDAADISPGNRVLNTVVITVIQDISDSTLAPFTST